jgi:hypothetical protein
MRRRGFNPRFVVDAELSVDREEYWLGRTWVVDRPLTFRYSRHLMGA